MTACVMNGSPAAGPAPGSIPVTLGLRELPPSTSWSFQIFTWGPGHSRTAPGNHSQAQKPVPRNSMRMPAPHIRHLQRPPDLCPIPQLLSLEPDFMGPNSPLMGWQRLNKATSILFFCEIYCFHIKRLFLRGSIFCNHMMILYSCPE